MVVQHNMQAMNASRMLNITSGNQAKSTEKLSSGYKINRAADDAAGLSISEKMRKQIRGLDQASTNAQDGVSAVQTAEGALTEVHSMLQRMNELAVQASNGTNSESDRSSIQDEINQLTTEIDRVAETTKFNETYLLKGDNGTKKVQISAHDAGLVGTFSQNSVKATFTMNELKVGDKYTIGGTEYEIGAADADKAMAAVKLDSTNAGSDGAKVKGQTVEIAGKTWTFGDKTDEELHTIKYEDLSKKLSAGTTVKYNGKSATIFSENAGSDGTDPNNKTLITAEGAYTKVKTELTAASSIGATGKAPTVDEATTSPAGKKSFTIEKGYVETKNDLSFSLHVGADADMTNKINVKVQSMSAKSLGLDGINVSDSTGKAATYAIDAIADAVSKVSAQRSSLGAVQNRLEHTIANVDNVVENTNAAESRIRDTDMAEEMVNYSKNNILAQAGQSMLAQANQSTQGVLSILG
ncbi:flagellin N-terminal helical domain-containing protein [Pseudobutyrivibrio ruminis]|uniref:Flagellin n=1 Tax=Pseudobutyrivibrio ruminis DSM 9787 TaxID=1123011 RepID=A0A285SEU4_9FIRM|nr:flagellin [Pseudobutyrivibrio ruminis]SOC06417.1 flagellin [Pseudobutyrivibrio ruminis DSM 9787]